MKKIILVTFLNKPVIAFKNEIDAKAWIKKMCEYYELNILDYSIQNILLYE